MKIKICRTVTLSVVLYGCETWSLTLMEEHRLNVFENRSLRKIVRSKRDKVTGERRKMHKVVLCKSDVWLTVHRNSAWIRKTN